MTGDDYEKLVDLLHAAIKDEQDSRGSFTGVRHDFYLLAAAKEVCNERRRVLQYPEGYSKDGRGKVELPTVFG